MKFTKEHGLVYSKEVNWSGGIFEINQFEHDEKSYEFINPAASTIMIPWRGVSKSSKRKVDGRELPIPSGFASVISPGAKVTGLSAFTGCSFRLSYSDKFLMQSQSFVKTTLSSNIVFPANLDMVTKSIGDELMNHVTQSEQIDSLLVEGAINLLSARIFQKIRGHELQSGVELPKEKLKKITEFIEAEMHRNIGLEELSGIAGLSVSHFCLAFRITTKFSPHQYLLKRRIETAKYLLSLPRNNSNIVDIALQLGFNSQSHFTRAFKTATGTTPSKFSRI